MGQWNLKSSFHMDNWTYWICQYICQKKPGSFKETSVIISNSYWNNLESTVECSNYSYLQCVICLKLQIQYLLNDFMLKIKGVIRQIC